MDISFVHNASSSSVSALERTKVRTYGTQAKAAGEILIPAVLSTFGHLSLKTRAVLREVSGLENPGRDASRSDRLAYRNLRTELSSSIQVENAKIIRNVLSRVLPGPSAAVLPVAPAAAEPSDAEHSDCESSGGGAGLCPAAPPPENA